MQKPAIHEQSETKTQAEAHRPDRRIFLSHLQLARPQLNSEVKTLFMTCLLESDSIQLGQQQKSELFQHRREFPTTTYGSTSTGLSTVKKRSHFSIYCVKQS